MLSLTIDNLIEVHLVVQMIFYVCYNIYIDM